jgi:hypothetical protein
MNTNDDKHKGEREPVHGCECMYCFLGREYARLLNELDRKPPKQPTDRGCV